MNQEYLSTIELAKKWRMHPVSLTNWRTKGKGPHYLKLGGKVLYPVTEVLKWEQAHLRKKT